MEKSNFKTIKIKGDSKDIGTNISRNNSSLMILNQIENNSIKNPFNIIKSEKISNLEKSISLLKLLSSKSQFMNSEGFKLVPDISKGKTFSFRVRNFLLPIKNSKSTFLNNKKNLYLTSYKINKKKLKAYNSSIDLNDTRKGNMIDLIHDKEIDVCLNLIKSIPERTRNKNKRLNSFKLYKNEKTNHLIKTIKFFTIDNINNQRIIEHQILNNTNYNPKLNPEFSTLNNNLLFSIQTKYKTNNLPFNNNYNQLNISNYTNKKNKNYTTTIKNNSVYNESNILINNSANSKINENNRKTNMIKSINNKINNITKNNIQKKLEKYQKNSINFRTGFVRSQKNIYGELFKFKKNKENDGNNETKIKIFNKKKEEKNKFSLPEIEEYKSILKDIENKKRKSQTLRKSQKNLDTIKEENDLVLKDKLVDELNTIYLNQKNIFLDYFRDNRNKKKIFTELYKKKVNENIENVNKIKREPNIYVDGYSLLDGNINKRLNQFNNLLGNKFYDIEQKMEKISKLCKISDEYENSIKNNENEIFKETNLYNLIFKPKFNFKLEKKDDSLDDIKLKQNKYNNNISFDSSKTFKIDNAKNVSLNTNRDDKTYNEYINFKKEYINRYSFDS